ncbi:acyl-coenzyme A synthetase/AMP-(fatty) acid ligase [Kitasatospora sp. MAP12-15]|uniref:class I adenylate-forming enzyme family protein n=1 Tax=unclassified Kitasatospora TaxID=2633591 RepID=UPI002475C3D6|nr:class I adenylate-forming enzyme family protein [Kitasatospora sp. MAP12-44]MDH6109415.1 acyl-coenzyme A synthetase/AMP-(fatty) acid ligase [Kitasatospora sp. MAP12-44]
MLGTATPHPPGTPPHEDWVDHYLLAGPADESCLRLGRTVHRATLLDLVDEQQKLLSQAGLRRGGTVTLCLPPSLAYIAVLLAAWRLGAQVSLLDHRLAQAEVDRALDRLAPQVVVVADRVGGAALRGYSEVTAVAAPRPGGRPAAGEHCLIQLSSGSTGPSKVIARTQGDLVRELERYDRLVDYPGRGGRTVLLASVVHVLGLVGGLLQSLHSGARLDFPERLTGVGILDAVAADEQPATLLGVPFHAELLAAQGDLRRVPQLSRMIVAGELTRPGLPEAFTARYGVPLGSMFGMTELGMIATDLSGSHFPAVDPAHGMELRIQDGELLVSAAASPYLGVTDPARWADGWLHTRDAAVIDPATGLVTLLGRLDSQVSIGGLKVDLTEVERTVAALPGVAEAVIVHDDGISAYLALDGTTVDAVQACLVRELASYKRPRRLYVLPRLPRTTTGKTLRDPAALRRAAAEHPAD